MIISRINDLEAHFKDVENQSIDKFKLIKDNIKSLSNQFEQVKLKDEHYSEKKMNYIKIFENKINERFNEEISKREEAQFRIFNIINTKFNILYNDLNNEILNRNNCIENLKLYLDSQNKDNPDLKKALNKEKSKRIENDNEINELINQELNNIENTIQHQKNEREESEQAMLETIKTMINKTKSDFKREKSNRKSAEENILSLIEDTINKINELDDYENNSEEEI